MSCSVLKCMLMCVCVCERERESIDNNIECAFNRVKT